MIIREKGNAQMHAISDCNVTFTFYLLPPHFCSTILTLKARKIYDFFNVFFSLNVVKIS